MRPPNYITRACVQALRKRLSARDHAILADVARLNLASARQLRTLHYDDSSTGRRMARLDLARLTNERVVARLDRRVGGHRAGSDGHVYAPDLAGQRILDPNRRRYRPPWTPQPMHLRHALAVSELYVGLRQAEHADASLTAFAAEPDCWRFFYGPGGARLVLKPDACLTITGPDYEDRAFIEIDRATESLPRITDKAKTYVRYFQSGREQAATGVFPLVVWVAPEERRTARLADALSHLPAEHWRLFAVTTDEMAAKQLISGAFAPHRPEACSLNPDVATLTITDDWQSWRPLRLASYGRSSNERPVGGGEQRAVKRNRILVGDARVVLRTLPSASVDCVITSPPYFLLRNYGVPDQLGAEATVGGYVDNVVAVCDEVARVLKPSGTFWLNLGDSYSRHVRYGAAPKSLLLAPERLLLGLVDHGWMVRNKLVWAKPNPMPSSVRDRLACTWEPLYLLVRSEHYFFDLDAIREPHTTSRKPARRAPKAKYGGTRPGWAGPLAGANDGLTRAQAAGRSGHPLGKNPGDVWTVATAGFRGAHFATFPTRLIERPILAAVPERVCTGCGMPWRRIAERLLADCACGAIWRPGVVLDPFLGAGTVAVAAEAQGRDWLGIELNREYAQLALRRIKQARERRGEERSPPEDAAMAA